MSEYIKPIENTMNRRQFLQGAGGLFSLVMLSACGVGSDGPTVTPAPKGDPEVCVLSYPGATVLGIVGNDPYRQVRVDQNNDSDRDFEYEGPAGTAPSLQYNEGPKGLDGQPLWDSPIQDEVCY